VDQGNQSKYKYNSSSKKYVYSHRFKVSRRFYFRYKHKLVKKINNKRLKTFFFAFKYFYISATKINKNNNVKYKMPISQRYVYNAIYAYTIETMISVCRRPHVDFRHWRCTARNYVTKTIDKRLN
jgi:hypothetical protein